MKLKSLLATLLLTTTFISSALFAEEAKKEEAAPPAPVFQQAGYNFVGASLGISKPVGANISTPLRFNYGVEYSYALSTYFAAGAFASRNEGNISHSSDINLAITRVGLEAIFSPTYESYFVLRSGISFVEASTKLNLGTTIFKISDTAHPFFVSPGFGWIFPVVQNLQFSPNMHYTHYFSTKDINEFNSFDVMVTLRYTL